MYVSFFTLSCINGKLLWNASSCIPQALLTPTNDFDISDANNFVYLSRSSRLYANNVDTTDASNSLL